MAALRLFVQQDHHTHCPEAQLHLKYGLLAREAGARALLQTMVLLVALVALAVLHIIHGKEEKWLRQSMQTMV
jgi:hypothetical protein